MRKLFLVASLVSAVSLTGCSSLEQLAGSEAYKAGFDYGSNTQEFKKQTEVAGTWATEMPKIKNSDWKQMCALGWEQQAVLMQVENTPANKADFSRGCEDALSE